MTPDVTLLAALLAGLVSFLSPCVLPLVPPYLVYLAGTSLERLADGEPKPEVRREAVLAAALFVCGFSTVFVALGASASVIGALIRTYSAELSIVAGIVIIAMGLHFLGVFRIGVSASGKADGDGQAGRAVGRLCDGTCLRVRLDAVHRPDPRGDPGGGGVRGDGGQRRRPARGLFAGLGIPFLLAAFAVEPFAAFLARFRRHLAKVEQVMGGLLVLTGIAFLTGYVSQASFWLLEAFPALGRIG